MAWLRMKHWLHIPQIADPVDRRNAPVLQVMLLALGVFPPLLWLYRIFGTDIPWRPGETISLSASLAISGVALWCLRLARQGKFQSAIRKLMVVVAIITVASHAISGLAAHIFEMPIFVLWMFVAGIMIGRRALWLMYGALVLALMLGSAGDIRLNQLAPSHAYGDGVIRSVMFFLIALVIDRSVAALRESLDEATSRTLDLEWANARLHTEMVTRERVQEQLLHAQKMEAVGQMASGLAHDFGHLLTLVDGYAAQAEKADSPERRDEALQGIRSASQRAKAQVRKLLLFSQRDRASSVTFDAVEALHEAAPMLRQTLRSSIQFEFTAPSIPTLVRIDREQFTLALLNIAANASEAMPEGGRFSLHARIDKASNMLDIMLNDNGPGIPESLMELVFEPFFTTKAESGGTGIGLAISRDMVVDAGGTLELERTDEESGASFRLRLPLQRAQAPEIAEHT